MDYRVSIRHFEVCLILWDWINQEPKDILSAIQPAGDMASDGERIATTSAVEKGSNTVVVTCLVDDMQVSGFRSKTPKNATVSVKFAERGFDMSAAVKGKSTFRKVVKKLPGKINKDQCSWKVEKGKVIINLVKAEEVSWAVQLSQRGLEQQSDEEDE